MSTLQWFLVGFWVGCVLVLLAFAFAHDRARSRRIRALEFRTADGARIERECGALLSNAYRTTLTDEEIEESRRRWHAAYAGIGMRGRP